MRTIDGGRGCRSKVTISKENTVNCRLFFF